MRVPLTLLVLGLCQIAPLWGQFVNSTIESGLVMRSGNVGVSFVDYDQDGFDDLLITRINDLDLLYHNNGNGRFTLMPSSELKDSRNSHSAIWFDMDNDGDLDLYLTKHNQPHQLFEKSAKGFEEITASAGIYCLDPALSLNTADLDQDGLIDLYLSNFKTENILYKNKGGNTFENKTAAMNLLDDQESMGSIFFDYDNDGDQDLYLVHDNRKTNYFYENQGNEVFLEKAEAVGINLASFGMGVDAADINNDGWLDLYITNLFENVLYLNKGDGTFQDISTSAGIEDYGMGWGTVIFDYDNDGFKDIYVANDSYFSDYANVLYRNNGDLTFSVVELDGDAPSKFSSYGVTYGDIENDGYLDLIVANRDEGDNVELLSNTTRNDNQWIGFTLDAINGNRAAIGSKITLYLDDGSIRYDELSSGHGYLSQHSFKIHFGLGNRANLDSIHIRWDGGSFQRITDLEANRYYKIIEGMNPVPLQSTVSTTSPNNDKQVRIFPNPSNGIITIQNDLNLEGEFNYSIYSLTGAVEAQGIIYLTKDHYSSITFDGKGLYFLQLSKNQNIWRSKIALF